jgi:hypothetical protein
MDRRRVRRWTLLPGPLLVGATMGLKWPNPGESFYSDTGQIIATLFVAMAIEFFAFGAKGETYDALLAIALLALSWLGLLACVRASAGSATGTTVALAGTGVTAASTLVSLSLYEKVKASGLDSHADDVLAAATVILFILAPVLVLIIL